MITDNSYEAFYSRRTYLHGCANVCYFMAKTYYRLRKKSKTVTFEDFCKKFAEEWKLLDRRCNAEGLAKVMLDAVECETLNSKKEPYGFEGDLISARYMACYAIEYLTERKQPSYTLIDEMLIEVIMSGVYKTDYYGFNEERNQE